MRKFPDLLEPPDTSLRGKNYAEAVALKHIALCSGESCHHDQKDQDYLGYSREYRYPTSEKSPMTTIFLKFSPEGRDIAHAQRFEMGELFVNVHGICTSKHSKVYLHETFTDQGINGSNVSGQIWEASGQTSNKEMVIKEVYEEIMKDLYQVLDEAIKEKVNKGNSVFPYNPLLEEMVIGCQPAEHP